MPLYKRSVVLTDNRNAFLVDDSTWQEMEIKLVSIDDNCVSSVVSTLKIWIFQCYKVFQSYLFILGKQNIT